MQKFLSIAAFKIPLIKDKPVDEWLQGIKATLEDVVGFNSGLLIYDKKGVLKHKLTRYPGSDKMRKIIEDLLL